MWWDILPSYAVTGVCLFMPGVLIYFTNKVLLGNPYKRAVHSKEDIHLFLRDMRISGNDDPYNQKRLENLGDEAAKS